MGQLRQKNVKIRNIFRGRQATYTGVGNIKMHCLIQ